MSSSPVWLSVLKRGPVDLERYLDSRGPDESPESPGGLAVLSQQVYTRVLAACSQRERTEALAWSHAYMRLLEELIPLRMARPAQSIKLRVKLIDTFGEDDGHHDGLLSLQALLREFRRYAPISLREAQALCAQDLPRGSDQWLVRYKALRPIREMLAPMRDSLPRLLELDAEIGAWLALDQRLKGIA